MSRSGTFDRGGAIGAAPGAAEYAVVLQAASALDGKLVALEPKTGKLLWETQIADPELG